MYSNSKTGYFKYQQNDVLSLSSVEIIDRLLKGLLANVERAVAAMEAGEIAKKGEKISRAIAIAGELQASLNFKEGGQIAENLNALYDFIIRELLLGNMDNDVERIKKLRNVILPIIEAWSEVVAQQKRPQQADHDVEATQPRQLQAAL